MVAPCGQDIKSVAFIVAVIGNGNAYIEL